MTQDRIEQAARECARRWYWTGSFNGGLGRDTDEAEAVNRAGCKDAIDRMAGELAALIRREREDAARVEREECAKVCDHWARPRHANDLDLDTSRWKAAQAANYIRARVPQ
jgi:hypothetical protein